MHSSVRIVTNKALTVALLAAALPTLTVFAVSSDGVPVTASTVTADASGDNARADTAVSASDVLVAPGGEVSDSASLVSALGGDAAALLREDGSVMLLKDIVLAEKLTVVGGELNILGAGARISGSTVSVEGGKLVIGKKGDSGDEPSVHFLSDGGSGRAFEVSGGALTLSDGVRIEGYRSDEGGAVAVSGGKLLMDGAQLVGCNAGLGGAVLITAGEVTMSSGLIGGCSAGDGSAVYLRAGKFVMSGGCIGKHSSLDSRGSTVEYGEPCVSEGGTVYAGGECVLSGGEIVSNTGAGVYVAPEGSLLLSGCSISSCTSDKGGGILNDGILLISDGSVSECSAELGGGVYNRGNTVISGGRIISCTATSLGGCLYNEGELSMPGGSAVSGSAELGACIFNTGAFAFSGGTVGHGNTESGIGAGIVSSGTVYVSSKAYVYNDSTLALLSDGGFTPMKISGELSGAEIMMHIEVIEGAGTNRKAVRKPGTAVVTAETPELLGSAVSHLRYGEDGTIEPDGTVSEDYLPLILICAGTAVAAAGVCVALILVRRAHRRRMEE